MSSLFTELFFWGFLACMNLLASVLVYNLTSLDLLQTHLSLGSPLPRVRSRSKSLGFLSPTRSYSRSTSPPPSQHLSTRKMYAGPSFPPTFIYFSLLAALLNLASSFVRAKQIHFLDFSALSISTLLSYLFVDLSHSASFPPSPGLSLQDSHLILSLYDWMSLFVSFVSLVCAAYNFATVKTLMLRERERTSTMWILGRSLSGTFRHRPFWTWRFFTSYWTRSFGQEQVVNDEDEMELLGNRGRVGNHMSNHGLSASIRIRTHSQTLDLIPLPPRQPPQSVKKGHWRTGSSSGCSVSSGFVGEGMIGGESESAGGGESGRDDEHAKSIEVLWHPGKGKVY